MGQLQSSDRDGGIYLLTRYRSQVNFKMGQLQHDDI